MVDDRTASEAIAILARRHLAVRVAGRGPVIATGQWLDHVAGQLTIEHGHRLEVAPDHLDAVDLADWLEPPAPALIEEGYARIPPPLPGCPQCDHGYTFADDEANHLLTVTPCPSCNPRRAVS